LKKVLLIIIDALSSRVVQSALKDGKLPTMQSLIDAGAWRDQCTAIFPSLTLAATPSISTGVYPRDHGLMGAYWYERHENRIVYFGGDAWMVMRQGPGKFLQDFLVGLNHHWLNADTIFEKVEKAGKKAASLNWFLYHGLAEHKIDMALLNLVPNAPQATTIWGPSTLHLGHFTNHTDTLDVQTGREIGHPFNRFGFEDKVTAKMLAHLAEEDAFPDFTLAYFPDNDFNSHEVGPENAVETLYDVDNYLSEMIEAYGGLEKFLSEMTIIITGDHSQSNIVDNQDEAAINLVDVLPDFRVSKVGQGWQEDEQIIICPNGRVASFYMREPTTENVNAVIENLLQDSRIDQVICRSNRTDTEKTEGFRVYTADRGDLHFKASSGDAMAKDRYGGEWHWSGDLDALGKTDQQDGVITFEEYPNAFERIAMLLSSDRSGDIWVTAKPGHDFVIPGVEAHTGGGSHGALHVLDSSPPLIIAGHPDDLTVPEVPRSVDLVPMSLSVLEMDSPYMPGASRLD